VPGTQPTAMRPLRTFNCRPWNVRPSVAAMATSAAAWLRNLTSAYPRDVPWGFRMMMHDKGSKRLKTARSSESWALNGMLPVYTVKTSAGDAGGDAAGMLSE